VKGLLTKLSKWQDYGWLILLLVVAYLAYRIIPAIDPRSGIDGWGDLFAALVQAVKGVMATLLAWLCKNLYWWEPGTAEESRWHDAIEADQKNNWHSLTDNTTGPLPGTLSARAALILVVKDRIEWLAWLVFWAWVFFVA
jgi:hypothetical protein